ncbi:glutaminase [Carboxylicivirga caseinilyticus]|uniref:glutaminase n=1 Tax=Carboxylicivirga caseinilyticus TaxID=3417572 RepID=UPI003D340D32|nr:glutaminase [Marinilabiliaceae bacterium A049]
MDDLIATEKLKATIPEILEEIQKEIAPLLSMGQVANYIPELGDVDQNQFGMVVRFLDGTTFETGNSQTNFSIQSISKVFSLTQAFALLKENLWNRLGKEPSGNPFNSLIQLENENGKPRNPFINAGAIVIADIITHHFEDPLNTILDFMREVTFNKKLTINMNVLQSEKNYGHRNAALAHFMKSYGNIYSEVEEVLDVYFGHCSVEMNCFDLATAFLYLANHGVHPLNGKTYLNASQTKRLNALMLTCGTYDSAGEFAFKVGLPGKSGVGGGIAGIIPGLLSIAVWSPGLDKCGNSLAGTKALELFTTKTGISIF